MHAGRSERLSLSAWLSTNTIAPAWLASGRRNSSCNAASAYFCGSTTHTMTSTRSTSRSHLEPVTDRRRVVVGEIEQHEASEVARLGVLEHRRAHHLVAALDAQPVQHLARALLAPDAREGGRGGRSPHADRRQVQPGDGVEQRGLPAAGGTGEGDDRVVRRQPESPAGSVDDAARRVDHRLRQPAVDEVQRAAERLDPIGQPRSRSSRGGAAAGSRSPGRLDPAQRGSQLRSGLRVDGGLGEPVVEPIALPCQHAAHARTKIRPRLLGELADRLVAEHRLEHTLADHPGPAGDTDLDARQPARVREHDDHQRHTEAVDAE